MLKTIKIMLCAIALAGPLFANAQSGERVLSYDSNIQVLVDSSIHIIETIQVVSNSDQIKRGIYRDFPVAYADSNGRRFFVSYEILSVTRDGSAEPYHTERGGNGMRLYIGEEDVFIAPGIYTYAIEYKTTRQLGYFNDHDELYWNVTGNGWVFQIDKATATVKLPDGVKAENITTALFTGEKGSVTKLGNSIIDDDGTVNFSTTKPLSSYEGLTIVVGWPKGFVTEPTASENFWFSVLANIDYIIGSLGLLFVLAFYLYFWNKRGRDPKKQVIIAHYESPQGFSPAFLRFITKMGNDSKGFAAAILNLGVKGKLSITEHKGFLKKTTYTLKKTNSEAKSEPSVDEKVLYDNFFLGVEEYVLETSKAAKISKIKDKFNDSLKDAVGNKYFKKNITIIVLGIILSIFIMIGTAISAGLVRYGVDSILEILFWPVLIIGMLAVNIIFGWLLRAYTIEGRKLLDEIEGFKLFLTVTEKDRLAFHNPPEKTPELFEKMLPYALALGVEHKWAQQFAAVFAGLKDKGENYAPIWYYGSFTNFNPESFASDVGKTFSGVVSSASTPPGSNSGFSGSSGGGGGGGGGGGW